MDLSGASAWTSSSAWAEWFADWMSELAGNAWGAVLVVLATKYWREKGSPESK